MSKVKLVLTLIVFSTFGSLASAASGSSFGFNLGGGFPYTSQFGLNYVVTSGFSMELGYNSVTISSGTASGSLTKPELVLKWHPFSGSFFLGLGLGQESLSVSATDVLTSLTAKATVSALTVTPSLGWMWGMGDKGLFVGVDMGFQSPSGASTTVEAPGLTSADQAYQDAEKAANDFGTIALPVFTMLRLGYLF